MFPFKTDVIFIEATLTKDQIFEILNLYVERDRFFERKSRMTLYGKIYEKQEKASFGFFPYESAFIPKVVIKCVNLNNSIFIESYLRLDFRITSVLIAILIFGLINCFHVDTRIQGLSILMVVFGLLLIFNFFYSKNKLKTLSKRKEILDKL